MIVIAGLISVVLATAPANAEVLATCALHPVAYDDPGDGRPASPIVLPPTEPMILKRAGENFYIDGFPGGPFSGLGGSSYVYGPMIGGMITWNLNSDDSIRRRTMTLMLGRSAGDAEALTATIQMLGPSDQVQLWQYVGTCVFGAEK